MISITTNMIRSNCHGYINLKYNNLLFIAFPMATGNSLAAIVIALVLFVAVSVAMAVYTARMNAVMEPKEPPASQKSDEERREAFIAKYGLTEREWDVFSQMISSDSSAQEIADCLFLSKRTVERHISALYEKTGAKSRITMYPALP